jgi:Arc/MetJ-type ribon-helix-helix transcriptional regulator
MSTNKDKLRLTVRLTKLYLDSLNGLVEQGYYNSRNEAVRAGLRMLFEHHKIRSESN